MSKKISPALSPERQLQMEMHASEALIANLRDVAGDDSEFFSDLVEGETKVFDILEKIVESESEDQMLVFALGEKIKALQARKARFEKSIEVKRTLVGVTLDHLEKKSHRFALGTWTVSNVRRTAIVIDEANIPAKFWKARDPEIDKKPLNEAVVGRFNALAEAYGIEDKAEKAAALAKVDEEFPEIPGATISNGGVTISVRV